MKAGVALFRLTAIMVFLQLLLGGLLTFNFISPELHIINGFIVFGLAIAALVVSLVSKPSFRPAQRLAAAMVVLILVQIALGFVTLNSGSQALAWVHFTVATGIYGMAIAGTFMAFRWDQITRGRTTPPDAAARHD